MLLPLETVDNASSADYHYIQEGPAITTFMGHMMARLIKNSWARLLVLSAAACMAFL